MDALEESRSMVESLLGSSAEAAQQIAEDFDQDPHAYTGALLQVKGSNTIALKAIEQKSLLIGFCDGGAKFDL